MNERGIDSRVEILFEAESFAAIQQSFISDCRSFLIETNRLQNAPLVIVGIRTGGDALGDRLAQGLRDDDGFPNAAQIEVGYLDISLYRDDFAHRAHWPAVQESHIPFSLDGKHVFLTDEVFFTGRTVRAALQAIMDLGRPARISLGVLFDRGGRELPINPDVVGQEVQVDTNKSLLVEFAGYSECEHDKAYTSA